MSKEGFKPRRVLAQFAASSAADIVTTGIALGRGLQEGNFLMDKLLVHYGFAALIGYKLLSSAFAFGLYMAAKNNVARSPEQKQWIDVVGGVVAPSLGYIAAANNLLRLIT